MKVFLFLAVMVCISSAQYQRDQCLCHRVRNKIISKHDIKDVQIYEANLFCDKVEIIVTNNSGLRYCLNPKLKALQRLMTSIMRLNNKTTTTTTPPEVTPAL